MSILKDFKDFAMRGNVVDMAVGVIIGTAFGKIVTSLVNDLLMPPIGLLTGGVDFSNKEVTLKAATGTTPAVTVKYGVFINNIVSFLIVAFCVFLMVKGMNRLFHKEPPAPAAPPMPPKEEVLLTEIRDILKTGVLKK